jgi:hypothetical protein
MGIDGSWSDLRDIGLVRRRFNREFRSKKDSIEDGFDWRWIQSKKERGNRHIAKIRHVASRHTAL